MTEHELDAKIISAFHNAFPGGVCFLEKTNAELIRDEHGRHLATERGKPDLVGCIGGRMMCFEDKKHPNTLTIEQHLYLKKAHKAGALVGMFAMKGMDVYFVPPEYLERYEFSWKDLNQWVFCGSANLVRINNMFHYLEKK